MKLNFIIFLILFLLVTSCVRVNENTSGENVKINNQEEAQQNSDDLVDGIGDISNSIDDLENIVN